VEFAAQVAGLDGTTAFLLLPPAFLAAPGLAAALAAGVDPGPALDGRVHARFSFDRRPLRHMAAALRALPAAPAPPSLLLPCAGAAAHLATPPQAALQPAAAAVDAHAAGLRERGAQRLNAEQRRAVAALVCGAARAAPYALNGPPGTGKTVTLVEAALQVLEAHPAARLLLCAPQNYSADLLCSALAAAGVGAGDMLRLNDPRRPPVTVKQDVLPFCRLSEATRAFELPPPEALASRRVVVCTCAAAALLRGGDAAAGAAAGGLFFFTHVLIDEAGQALAPEALLPLGLLRPGGDDPLDPGWGSLLAGDPQQLGPVVRSPVAAAAGLGGSLLEALIACHAAAAPALAAAGRALGGSTLVRNYRSHRRLLDLPSKMFYGDSLLAAADPDSGAPWAFAVSSLCLRLPCMLSPCCCLLRHAAVACAWMPPAFIDRSVCTVLLQCGPRAGTSSTARARARRRSSWARRVRPPRCRSRTRRRPTRSSRPSPRASTVAPRAWATPRPRAAAAAAGAGRRRGCSPWPGPRSGQKTEMKMRIKVKIKKIKMDIKMDIEMDIKTAQTRRSCRRRARAAGARRARAPPTSSSTARWGGKCARASPPPTTTPWRRPRWWSWWRACWARAPGSCRATSA
jgi:hypothetical protein